MMKSKQILIAVSLKKDLTKDLPAIIASSEEELQKVSSELGRILEGDVCRLANGLVVITTPER